VKKAPEAHVQVEYLTIKEVAEYLKLPEETVYKYARTGMIPASKLGRHWRFDRKRIDDWVSNRLNKSENGLTVLIVDDENVVQKVLGTWLERAGHRVIGASDGSSALKYLQDIDVDLILLDLRMPGMDGAELLGRIRAMEISAEVAIITAFFDSELMDRAMQYGPLRLLKKPVDRNELLQLVNGIRAN